ncbi:MAG: hypothetical protein R3F59_28405 [Myxococcota bacterium]
MLAHELNAAQHSVARSMRLQATGGARIVEVAGLVPDGSGSVELGSLYAGQHREVWATLQIPVGAAMVDPGLLAVTLTSPSVKPMRLVADLAPVRVTDDPSVAFATLGDAWAASVVDDGYQRMRTDVAAAVQAGDQQRALARIEEYQQTNALANGYANNPIVTDNLQQLPALVQEVNDTFVQGASQRNLWSKGTRSDAYGKRRKGSFTPMPAPAPQP